MTSKIFRPWKNCLDQEPKIISEEKKVIRKIEFKNKQKYDK